MEWKFFACGFILVFLADLGASSGSALVGVRIEDINSGREWSLDCGDVAKYHYANGFGLWATVPPSEIGIISCSSRDTPQSTTPQPSTTSSAPSSSSESTIPYTSTTQASTSQSSSTYSNTFTSTTDPGTTSQSTFHSSSTVSTPTSSKSVPETTEKSTSTPSVSSSSSASSQSSSSVVTTTTTTEVVSTTSTVSTTSSAHVTTVTSSPTTTTSVSSTTTLTSTTFSSTSTSTAQTTTLPSVCPAIPPPPSGGWYTDADRNAYCALAEGKGSYCKCEQKPPGQVCKHILNGTGLNCACGDMCTPSLRRLLIFRGSSVEDAPVSVTVDIVFQVSNQASMEGLLTSLRANTAEFKSAIGLTSGEVDMVSFQYSAEGSSPNPPPASVGGTVRTLIDLTVSNVATVRRLLEVLFSQTESERLNQAVVDSLNELVVPNLPQGSSVSSEIVNGDSNLRVAANVTFSVPSDLSASESQITTFLSSDASGAGALPSMISAKSSLDVGYSPGYVPIVWSTAGGIGPDSVINILPYVLAGVGVVVVALTAVLFKYRYVIRSRWEDLFRDRSGGWNFGVLGNGENRIERGKSELSSTPDTATNLDADEFDDIFLRSPTRQSI